MTMLPTRDGHGLYVKNWGSGRPVVLIHGWPLSADSWDYQAMKIAEAGFRVIAYDRRGFGRSDQPFGAYDYDSLSDDLSDVMTAMVVDDAQCCGGLRNRTLRSSPWLLSNCHATCIADRSQSQGAVSAAP